MCAYLADLAKETAIYLSAIPAADVHRKET
jgi:hypothetical protein